MNDDAIREAAMERLLTAELAELLVGATAQAAPESGWSRSIVAAVALFSVGVAVGVAWLADSPSDPAQEPVFDPVDPWYEHEWPFRMNAFVPAAPTRPAADTFGIALRGADSAELAAALDHPTVRRLALSGTAGASAQVSPELWRRVATRPELEVLMLSGPFAFCGERLRDLRLAPSLKYAILVCDAVTLDLPTVRALAELPRLRGVTAAMVDATTDGIAALAGLQHLDTLVLSRLRMETPSLLSALTRLRGLRALIFEDTEPNDAGAESLQPLATMRDLQVLDIMFHELDDAALTVLPPQLESLSFSSRACTGDGVLALRRLTSLRVLRLRGVNTSVEAVLPQVICGLPLERFESLVNAPDTATWQALQSRPKLRRLTFRRQRSALADVIAGCMACRQLETLTLFEPRLPLPEEIGVLKEHPTLRRIEFHLDSTTGEAVSVDAELLASLRASVRAEVVVDEP